jgi:hypothetical protein
MFYNEANFDFSEILNPWNEKWRGYIAKEDPNLRKILPAKTVDLLGRLVIKDVIENYSTDVRFHELGNENSRYSATKYKQKEKWTVYFGSHTPAQKVAMEDLIEGFPFGKIKNELKKKRESLVLEKLKENFIGLEIIDVIDDGTVIKIATDNEKTYEYNDFLRISAHKQMHGL